MDNNDKSKPSKTLHKNHMSKLQKQKTNNPTLLQASPLHSIKQRRFSNACMRRAKTQCSSESKPLLASDPNDNLDFFSKSKMKIYDKRLAKANDVIKDMINNILTEFTIEDIDSDTNNLLPSDHNLQFLKKTLMENNTIKTTTHNHTRRNTEVKLLKIQKQNTIASINIDEGGGICGADAMYKRKNTKQSEDSIRKMYVPTLYQNQKKKKEMEPIVNNFLMPQIKKQQKSNKELMFGCEYEYDYDSPNVLASVKKQKLSGKCVQVLKRESTINKIAPIPIPINNSLITEKSLISLNSSLSSKEHNEGIDNDDQDDDGDKDRDTIRKGSNNNDMNSSPQYFCSSNTQGYYNKKKESTKIINLVSLNEPNQTESRLLNENSSLQTLSSKESTYAIYSKSKFTNLKTVTQSSLSNNKTPQKNPEKAAKDKEEKGDRTLVSYQNVYDSFSDEEANIDELITPEYVLLPSNKFLLLWELINALFVIYSIVISPYILAFNLINSFCAITDVISDLIFLIDIIMNFFIAYFDEDFDILIVSKNRIAIHYLQTYFILDLISSIPFSLIIAIFNISLSNVYMSIQNLSRIAKFIHMLDWTKIARLINIAFTNNEAESYHHSFRTSKVFRVLQFTLFLIVFMHLTVCMWIFIGESNSLNYYADNWISQYKLRDESNVEIYIAGLYFLFGTMLSAGYGDIAASSTSERLFIIIFMLFGCLIFSFVLTSLSAFFSQMDSKTVLFSQKEILLEQIRGEYKMPNVLYEKLKKTLKHEHSTWKEDQLKLIESLPGSLRNNLYLQMHENQIKHLQFFKNQSYDFILFAVPLFKSVRFSKDDIIISFGDLIEEMYLIVKGMIGLHLGYKFSNYEIGVLRYGEHFGDIIMYLNDQSNYEIKVKTKFSEVFCLSKTDFASIKLNFRYAINDILQHSYLLFAKLETKRKMAIEHFNTYGNMNNFRNYFYYHYRDDIDDSSFLDDQSGNFGFGGSPNGTMNAFKPNNSGIIKSAQKNVNELRTIQSRINNDMKENIGKGDLFEGDSMMSCMTNSPRKKTMLFDVPMSPIKIQKTEGVEGNNNGKVVGGCAPIEIASTPKKSFNLDSSSMYNESLFNSPIQAQKTGKSPLIYIGNVNINYNNNNNNNNSSSSNLLHPINQAQTFTKRMSVMTPSNQSPLKYVNTNNNVINNQETSIRRRYSNALSPDFFKRNNNLSVSQMILQSPRKENKSILNEKDSFLLKLNNKIEQKALFQQNKILLQDYLIDFIDDKKNEDEMKKIIKKLSKIKVNLTKNSND